MSNVVDNVSIKISMNSAAVSSSGKQIERAIKSVRRNYVELEQQFELLNRRQQKYTEQLRQATVDGNQAAIQAAKDQILSERELAAVKDKLTLSYEKRLAAIDREQAKLAELRAEKAQQIEIDRRMAEQLVQSAANLGITPGPNRSDRRRPQHDRQSDRPVIDPVTGQVHVDAEELRRAAEEAAQAQKRLAANLGVTAGTLQQSNQRSNRNIDVTTGQVTGHAEALKRAAEEAAQAQKRLAANLGIVEGSSNERVRVSSRDVDVVTGALKQRTQELLQAAEEAAKAERQLAANLGITPGPSRNVQRPDGPADTRFDVVSGHSGKELDEIAAKQEQIAREEAEARAAARRGLRDQKQAYIDLVVEATEAAEQAEREARALRDAERIANRRATRQNRESFLDEVQAVNEQAINDENARQAERNRLQQEGAQYMQQFAGVQGRMNQRLAEASDLLNRGAIDARQYAIAVRQIRTSASLAGRALGSLKIALDSFLGPVAAAYLAWQTLQRVVRDTADFQRAQARFKVFTGSLENANRLLAQLRALSSTTPISFAGAQRATATLLQYGTSATEAFSVTQRLAEVSGGSTERLENLALAMAQVQAAGRLMGQENIQLVNAGFSPLRIISEQTGKSMAQLKKEMEEGMISTEMVRDALRQATDAGGQFDGILEEIGDTLAGQLAIASSRVEQLSIAVGQLLEATGAGSGIELFIDEMSALIDVVNAGTVAADTLRESLTNLSEVALPDWLTDRLQGTGPQTPLQLAAASFNIAELGNEMRKGQAGGEKFYAILAKFNRNTNDTFPQLVKMVKEYNDAVADTEGIRKRAEAGEKLTQIERQRLEEANRLEREAKNTSDEVFAVRLANFKDRLKEADTIGKRYRAIVNFVENVGAGRLSDEQYKQYQAIKKVVDDIEESEQNRITAMEVLKEAAQDFQDTINEIKFGEKASDQIQKTAELLEAFDPKAAKRFQELAEQASSVQDLNKQLQLEGITLPKEAIDALDDYLDKMEEAAEARKKLAFDSAIESSQDSLIGDVYGKDANRLQTLIDSSSESEQERLRALVDQGKSYQDIVASLTAQEQLQLRLLALQEKQAEKAKAIAEFRDLQSNIQFEQDKAKFGEEQARQNQLQRDSNLTAGEAKTFQEAEKQLSTLERLNKLADEIKENTKDPYVKMVEELADLRVLLAEGQITQQQFDKERNRLLLEANKAEANAVDSANSPNATQSGSREALARVAEIQLEAIKQQIKERDRNFLIAKANKDANVKSQQLLNEIRNKPGVIGI